MAVQSGSRFPFEKSGASGLRPTWIHRVPDGTAAATAPETVFDVPLLDTDHTAEPTGATLKTETKQGSNGRVDGALRSVLGF
jgi:predicted RecA/RadA family phage recombinase